MKDLIMDLINALPKCFSCKNRIATFDWFNYYGENHLECDDCTFKYGRDVRMLISENNVVELSYSKPQRRLLKVLKEKQ